MADRWTPETENLVAMELEDVLPQEVGALPDEAFYVDARRVLAALADAGLLLPPGGETRTKWGVKCARRGEDWVDDGGAGATWTRGRAEAEIEYLRARPDLEIRTTTLVRRAVTQTPWEVVDDHS